MTTKETITPAHIPDSLFVGYQRRENTLNGKLSFVSAENKSGKLYSESQFNHWCSEGIAKDTFPNEPMHGFYLNKRRKRQSSVGSDAMRVFHPLGFEFEIGMANIAYILQYANVNMSEITSRCVIGWVAGKLTIIPENSPLFLVSYSIKDPTLEKVKTKLTVGAHYITKNAEKCIYLGEHDIYYKQTLELSKDSQDAFSKEHRLEINKITADRYSPDLIIKAPVKQHLCYDVTEQEFIPISKSTLKFLCPTPVLSKEEVENLVNDFKNSAYGSPTVIKCESNSEHIFGMLKDVHTAIFNVDAGNKREYILGVPNDSTGMGLYVHTQYFEEQIEEALNLESKFWRKDVEEGKRLRKTVTPLFSLGCRPPTFFSYIILSKLYQREIIKNMSSINFDYSVIDLIFPEFNKFRIFDVKRNNFVEMIDLNTPYSERFNKAKANLMKFELFDLTAIEHLTNECVDAIEHLVKDSNNVFTEEVCAIIYEKLVEFFESQKKKMMINIDKSLKAIVIENETQSYRSFVLSD